MLDELRLRLRLMLLPSKALPVPVRLTSVGFVDFGGVVYESFEEFVAALRRIRPKDARVLPGQAAEYERVAEVFRAFQVANVGTFLGLVANVRDDLPGEKSKSAGVG